LAGVNGEVWDIKEAINGDIYICGEFTSVSNSGVSVANTKGIARWSKANKIWEAVGNPVTGATIIFINCMAFDANGDLYVGGDFTNLAGIANADYFAKYTVSTNTWSALGSGITNYINTIEIAPDGTIYIGGVFTSIGGNANCNRIAYFDKVANKWSPLSAGLNGSVLALKFAPDGKLLIGGQFTNADGANGDYICWWDGSAFKSFTDLGASELNGGPIYSIDINPNGTIIIGGIFTNAGGDDEADFVAAWRGNNWGALMAGGLNSFVETVYCDYNGDIYLCGDFSIANGFILADKVVKSVQGTYQPLDIDLPGTEYTNVICKASDGSLYLGGLFNTAGTGINALSAGAVDINVSSGSANTYPRIIVIGPGKLNSITNYSTGAHVEFNDLTLLAGERLDLNFDPLDLKFTSSWAGRGSVLRYVNAGSDYGNFYLKPGVNSISVFMDKATTTLATKAWMAWKPRFWGIDGALLE
jgi:hypothetical protein